MKSISGVTSETFITSIQHHSYAPYTQTYGNQEEIRIAVQSQNCFVLLSDSSLYLEGYFLRNTDAAQAADPNRIGNFASYLFESMRYELNGTEIDRCKNVGATSTLKALTSIKRSELIGLHSASLDDGAAAANGFFSLQIPLKLYMGFFEDYKNVVMNARHELIMVRSRNDINCFNGANNNYTIAISKIKWRVPHIKFDDHMQLKMLKQIESDRPIPLAYRSWELFEYPSVAQATSNVWSVKTSSHLMRPRYVILAFQTNRNNQINTNITRFDHINLTDARLYLNSECYPNESLNLDFARNRGAIAYNMYTNFKETYYHDGSGQPSDPILTYAEWMASPIFVFDCSRQNEALKASGVDVKIEFKTSQAVPGQTTAICLIIHDNIAQYNPLTNIVFKNI